MKKNFVLVLAMVIYAFSSWASWEPSMTLNYSIAYSFAGTAPRDNRGIAVSPDGQYLYLGYNNGPLFRRVNISTSAISGSNSIDRAKSIAVDDQGRVYNTAANGEAIKIYNSDLSTLLYSIPMSKSEGIAVKREAGLLYLYATERSLGTIKRFLLSESGGSITAATLNGFSGSGVATVSMVSGSSGIRGIAIAPDGSILVADPGNGTGTGRIAKLNSNGTGQQNFTYTGANNPYYFTIIDGQLFVTQGSYSTFPSRVGVINYNTMTLAGFITPPWSSMGIKTTDAADMISGIAAFPDNTGFYVTWENGSASDDSYKEPVIKIKFPVPSVVENPVFSLATGTYNSAQTVSIICPTAASSIRYTTDGTNPSETIGTLYTAPINVTSTTTIKAIAYKSGMTNSTVKIAYYNIFIDADNDGVTDGEDEYPNDPTRAFNNYFPAKNRGTLAFEDSWPSKGDYDMNDVVVDYQFKNVMDANNKLVETFATFVLKASGAGLNSGFGFQFANSNINSSDINVSGSIFNADPSYIILNSNGTEANQNKPTIIVFDNVFKVLQHPGVGTGINTTMGLPYVTPVTITIHITYTNNTYTEQQLDIAHFNPFIIVNKVRGKEVHLPDYTPTNLANLSFFGTNDDNSIAGQNKYYKTKNNLPWALNIYETFSYPVEKAPINEAYNHFIDWVISNGESYTDWYKDNSGNRNTNKIFVP